MKCNKSINLKKGWRYCSFIKHLGFKNDTIFDVYIGCPCKKHDMRYSIEGEVTRRQADYLFKKDVQKEFNKAGKKGLGKFISFLMWIGVVLFGWIIWNTWSSQWADRYQ